MAATAKRNVAETHSAESREGLTSWWSKFKSKPAKKDPEVAPSTNPRFASRSTLVDRSGIFSVPLHESIAYANVAISLYNSDGKSFIYGFIPIVVAKCGLFLKDNATETEGIFRLNGSAKRIKDLQNIFDEPPKYGKGLDWSGFTVHDAANILRRYLNHLPDPIIPYDWYNAFRQPLKENWPKNKTIPKMQELVSSLPSFNRQLLLYILDLLAVFASKAELNRMTSENLSAIFQPGLITHPDHDMIPHEYKLSQEVLVFLIDNQSHFLLDNMCEPTNDRAPSPPAARKSGLMRRRTLQMPKRSPSLRQSSATGLVGEQGVQNDPGSTSMPLLTSRTNSKSGSLSRSNTVPTKKRVPPARSVSSQERVPRHASTPISRNGVPSAPIPESPEKRSTLRQEIHRGSEMGVQESGSAQQHSAEIFTPRASGITSADIPLLSRALPKTGSPMSSRTNLISKTDTPVNVASRSVSTTAANENSADGDRSRRTSRGSSLMANDAEFSVLGGRRGLADAGPGPMGSPSGASTSVATVPSTASTGDKTHVRQKESKVANPSPSKFSNLFKKKPRHQSISSTSEAGGRRDLDK